MGISKHLNSRSNLYNHNPPGVAKCPDFTFSMEPKIADIFIDGNNFYHNLKNIIEKPKRINFFKIAKLIEKRFNIQIKQIKYYNSIPNKEDIKRYNSHKSFLDKLTSKGVHVYTRELHGKKNYEREKGVDILIATDMIKFCLINSECDVCIIIIGDADFLPVMQLIKDSKKEAIVSSVFKGFSQKFREGKFRYLILKKEDILNCLD